MRRQVVAGLMLGLGACGEGEAGRDVAAPIAAGTDYKAKIEALSAEQRDAVMLRAVRDAGHDCQEVVGSAYGGAHFGMPGWVARCGDGRDWMIMLGQGGQAHVARREEKKEGPALGAPAPGSVD